MNTVPKNPFLIPASQDVVINNCRIEGAFVQAAIYFEESAIDIQVRQCRIWKAPVGILFGRPSQGTIWKVDISSNSLSTISDAGIVCEDVGPMRKNENRLVIERNFFIRCGKVSHREGDFTSANFVSAKGNYRARGVESGNQPIFPTEEADVPPSLSENLHDKQFLLYQRDEPLYSLFEGKPVGAVE